MEITCDREIKHPSPWVQIPVVGPFDSWYQATRLGIRIEFQDEKGQWKSQYLKSDYHEMVASRTSPAEITALGEEIHHMDITWVDAIKIIATLLHWRWQPDGAMSRQILTPFIIKRRSMNFNFHSQQLVIDNIPLVDVPCPKLLTLDETSRLIEKRFGFDISIGFLPNPILMRPNHSVASVGRYRTKCDLCSVVSLQLISLSILGLRILTSAKAGPRARNLSELCNTRWVVRKVSGMELLQCPLSATLGRFCTFTERVEEREDLGDLVYVARDEYPVQGIPHPPNFSQYLQVQEESAEQPIGDGGAEGTDE
jgi:hypothetical protein